MTQMTWRQIERALALIPEVHGLGKSPRAQTSTGSVSGGWDDIKAWAPKRKAKT